MSTRITRLAPSPSGTLHLGNARTFIINWALARQNNWRIIMRIEDLDQSRVRPGAAESAQRLLQWLGITFDDGPYFQSHDLKPYRQAMRSLAERGLAYSCQVTRRQILAAVSAPHDNEGSLRFPAELRPMDRDAHRFSREDTNYRFAVDGQAIEIEDAFAGVSTHDSAGEVGDFLIWTRLGVPAYQLAVVVDDARQGITDVVRGDDLLSSAARQTLLYQALGLQTPRWWHVPLVLGADGRRLAKRHGDTNLETFQSAGVQAERIIGLLGKWCGVCADHQELSAEEFLQRFDVDVMPHEPAVFTQEDHEWLLQAK